MYKINVYIYNFAKLVVLLFPVVPKVLPWALDHCSSFVLGKGFDLASSGWHRQPWGPPVFQSLFEAASAGQVWIHSDTWYLLLLQAVH